MHNRWRWKAREFFLCVAAVGVMGLLAAMAGAGATGLASGERLLIFLGGLGLLLWGGLNALLDFERVPEQDVLTARVAARIGCALLGLAVLLWSLLLEEDVYLAVLSGCALLLAAGCSILHVVWKARRNHGRNL